MDVDRDVVGLVRSAADHLAEAGYDVAEVEVPDLAGTWQLWADLIMTELHVLQEKQMREVAGADFQQTLDSFLSVANLLDGEGYMKAIAQRSRILRNWLLFLEEYPVVLTPLSVKPTPPVNADLGGAQRVKDLFWNDVRFMSSINVLGLPAAVVPVGLLEGKPIGVQLIASRYREDICLAAAAAIEHRAGTVVQKLWKRKAAG
jgi:amidase